MAILDQQSVLPDDDGMELLHCRQYETRTYRLDADHMLVRGAIVDTKPAGLYIHDDPQPLVMHDMLVDLTVAIDGFVITDAEITFRTFPDEGCPRIIEHYNKLVGLSIARGFNRNVRELFGGPRGCAHTSALLQAMAPAVVQSIWSLRAVSVQETGGAKSEVSEEDRQRSIAANVNTCHVWAEDGQHVELMRKGIRGNSGPIPVRERLTEMGQDPETWFGLG